MKSLSGSLTWIASENLLRPRATFCFSSLRCRNWWAAVLSQLSGANPCCLMSCFNFQQETEYQKVHTLHFPFFLSLFPCRILLSELHSQVLVEEVRDEKLPFSLVLGILSYLVMQGISIFPRISGVGTSIQRPKLPWVRQQSSWHYHQEQMAQHRFGHRVLAMSKKCNGITSILHLLTSLFLPSVAYCKFTDDHHDYPSQIYAVKKKTGPSLTSCKVPNPTLCCLSELLLQRSTPKTFVQQLCIQEIFYHKMNIYLNSLWISVHFDSLDFTRFRALFTSTYSNSSTKTCRIHSV